MGKREKFVVAANKAAQIEDNDEDNGDQLTSLSIPLDDTNHADCNKYAQKSRHTVGARDDQDILIACH